jgi:hypothetical protein
MKLKEAKVAAILTVMFVLVGSVYAADLIVPHTFSPGTPAKSSEVNENFTTIYSSALTVPMKACSIWVSGNWRDTMPVPQGWTTATCSDYRRIMGAVSYNLVCFFNNSFSCGTDNGGIPNPNCGW